MQVPISICGQGERREQDLIKIQDGVGEITQELQQTSQENYLITLKTVSFFFRLGGVCRGICRSLSICGLGGEKGNSVSLKSKMASARLPRNCSRGLKKTTSLQSKPLSFRLGGGVWGRREMYSRGRVVLKKRLSPTVRHCFGPPIGGFLPIFYGFPTPLR